MLSRKLLHAAISGFWRHSRRHPVARPHENSVASTGCANDSRISVPAGRAWHAECITYATVEEWDGGPSQQRAGASIRDGAAGVQQMSSRFNNYGLPEGSPHFSPPEGRRGLPHLVGPSFLRAFSRFLTVKAGGEQHRRRFRDFLHFLSLALRTSVPAGFRLSAVSYRQDFLAEGR
jgi:hypothetical protein